MKRVDFNKPHQFFFETLGNHVRWDITRLLRKGPQRVTAIAEKLGCEQSLVSHHLRRLLTCGFVRMETNGPERIYHLNTKTIGPLLELVDQHINHFCKKACGG